MRELQSLRVSVKGQGKYTPGQMLVGNGKFKMPKVVTNAGKSILKDVKKQAIESLKREAMSAIVGQGLYQHANGVTNYLIDSGHTQKIAPRFYAPNDETGSLVFECEELVSRLYAPSGVDTVTNSFAFNPGLPSYKKLYQMLCNFEKYQVEQLIFTYRPTLDLTSSTTGQVGQVCMTFLYDPSDNALTDYSEASEYHGSVTCKLTESCELGVECDPRKNDMRMLCTRSFPVPINADLKGYDLGTLNLIIADSPVAIANQCIGELWIRYKIRGLMPKLAAAVGKTLPRDFFVSPSTAARNATATGVNLLGNGGQLYKGYNNNLGCVITQSATGFTVIFPAYFTGTLRVYVNVKALAVVAGAALGWNAPAALTVAGKVQTLNNFWGENGEPANILCSPTVAIGGASGLDVQLIVDLQVQSATAGVNNSLTINGFVGCTNLVQTTIDIVPFNNYGSSATSQPTVQDVLTGNVVAGSLL